METEKDIQKKQILYCADPQHLTITMLSYIRSINKQIKEQLSENIRMKASEKKALSACNNFPVEVEGIWYFETEDDARRFIKRLIGF
jgi:hypothetical protein